MVVITLPVLPVIIIVNMIVAMDASRSFVVHVLHWMTELYGLFLGISFLSMFAHNTLKEIHLMGYSFIKTCFIAPSLGEVCPYGPLLSAVDRG